MSGICSAHRNFNPDCATCSATPEDIFGKEVWQSAVARAEAAGTMTCPSCNFTFYRTTNLCPKCSRPWNDDGVRDIDEARRKSRDKS